MAKISNVTLSVIIPTRNRPNSLLRLLHSLQKQQFPLQEVIIVDASDAPAEETNLRHQFPELPIRIIPTFPSVCHQRNLGIRTATAEYLFMCDDDIEISSGYLDTLIAYIDEHPEAAAVSGLILQQDSQNQWQFQYPPKNFRELCVRFITQTSIWGEIELIPTNWFTRLPMKWLENFYKKRGNTFTLSGFPLITSFSPPVFTTAVYGLGASIMRRSWLLKNPYDEQLDSHGIGDNYGLAIHFPGEQPIHVLTTVHAYHHLEEGNRLLPDQVHLKRMVALRRFMRQSERFNQFNEYCLNWSLISTAFLFLLQGKMNMARASLKALRFYRGE